MSGPVRDSGVRSRRWSRRTRALLLALALLLLADRVAELEAGLHGVLRLERRDVARVGAGADAHPLRAGVVAVALDEHPHGHVVDVVGDLALGVELSVGEAAGSLPVALEDVGEVGDQAGVVDRHRDLIA